MEKKHLFMERWSRLQKMMDAEGLDVVVVHGKGIITQYGYLTYYSDYYPVLRPGYVVFARGEEPVLLLNTRADYFLAKETSPIADIRYIGTGNVIDAERQLLEELIMCIEQYKPSTVGMVGMQQYLSYDSFSYVQSCLGNEKLREWTSRIAQEKAIKTEEEIKGIRQAYQLAEKSFELFKHYIQVGKTPAEIAGEVERYARGNGAIDTLVFIEEGPYFLRKPTLNPLRGSRLITAYVELIDSEGYWVEKAGLFALGELDHDVYQVGEACVNAMEDIKVNIKPGHTVGDIARIIRSYTDPLQARIGIWHGHGVGVDHDLPIIRDGGEDILKNGMVLSVHPNFTNAQETVGASIADVFVVHDDRMESLCQLGYDIVHL